jgi:hypothetical protein
MIVLSGVMEVRIEARPPLTFNIPQKISAKGTALPNVPKTRNCPHVGRSLGMRAPIAIITTSKAISAIVKRTKTSVKGVISLRATEVRKNDPPHRNDRKTSNPQYWAVIRGGEGMQMRLLPKEFMILTV